MWVKCKSGRWVNLQLALSVEAIKQPGKDWRIEAQTMTATDNFVREDENSTIFERPVLLAEDLSEDVAKETCNELMMEFLSSAVRSTWADLPVIIRRVEQDIALGN